MFIFFYSSGYLEQVLVNMCYPWSELSPLSSFWDSLDELVLLGAEVQLLKTGAIGPNVVED